MKCMQACLAAIFTMTSLAAAGATFETFRGYVPKEIVEENKEARPVVDEYAKVLALLRAINTSRKTTVPWDIKNIEALKKEVEEFKSLLEIKGTETKQLTNGDVVCTVIVELASAPESKKLGDVIALCARKDFCWEYNEESLLLMDGKPLGVAEGIKRWKEGWVQRGLFEGCDGFVIVGTASKNGDDLSREEKRARNRAKNFAEALKLILGEDGNGAGKHVWTLNLGRFSGRGEDSDEQRPVIILGVQRLPRNPDISNTVATALREKALPEWININNYSRPDAMIEEVGQERSRVENISGAKEK